VDAASGRCGTPAAPYWRANRTRRSGHGHDRGRDFREAIEQGAAAVVERGGRLTGYTTQIAFPDRRQANRAAEIAHQRAPAGLRGWRSHQTRVPKTPARRFSGDD